MAGSGETSVERARNGRSLVDVALAVGVGLFAALVAWHFHDRGWWAPDDGAYAHVAATLLAGGVLAVDVHDVHPGYVHAVNVAAFRIFGLDLVSLRYPLIPLTVLQSVLAFALVRPAGRLAAVAAGLAAACLGFVQFPNPTANWYVLACAFVLAGVLAWTDHGPRRLVLVGIVLAVALLFRQLSGVFLAMAALTWLLCETGSVRSGPPRLARAVLAIIAAGLAYYLWSKQSLAALVLFGLWPLLAVGLAAARTRLADGEVVRMIGWLALGFAIGAAPLAVYLLHAGIAEAWFADVVVRALRLDGLDFVAQPSFGIVALLAGLTLATDFDWPAFPSALGWLVLLAAPIAVGIACAGRQREARPHPLIVIAVFLALVAVHYQIPVYLLYGSAMSLAALLLAAGTSGRAATPIAIVVLATCGVFVAIHAGQPVARSVAGVVAGEQRVLDAPDGIDRARLAMQAEDARVYTRLVALVQEHAPPGAPILALPFHPEFYFLADRPAAIPFLVASYQVDEAQGGIDGVLAALAADPPRVVIDKPGDKYQDEASRRIVASLAGRYTKHAALGGFDLYVLDATASGALAAEKADVDHRAAQALEMPVGGP